MIFNQSRFVALKEALTELGVTGMTITQVMGCGTQKGHTNYYRGIKVEEAALLPKIKLEVVVSKVPVEDVISLAKKVLYTGHIGDGKIFVYDVENVVKVRTGEEGYDALQGDRNPLIKYISLEFPPVSCIMVHRKLFLRRKQKAF